MKNDKLRQIRTRKGVSLYRLSKLAGVDYSGLHRFENGKRDIYLRTAIKIAAVLNCKIDEFICKNNEERRQTK